MSNMRRTKKCPKCGGEHILLIEGWDASPETGHAIALPGIHLRGGTVILDRYVCAGCGYTEAWIQKPEDVVKMIKKAKNG
jgi:ribosomal protein S27AE